MADDSFDIVNKAKDLMKHTYKMTGNKDRYPSKYIMLIQDMQKICMQIRHCIRFANKTPLQNNSEERLKMQSDVITLCDELSDDVEMSLEFNLIGSDVSKAWQKKISDVKYMVISWRESDKRRLKFLNKKS